MKKSVSSLLLRLSLLTISALGFISGPASAENPRITEPTDFWFLYEQETTFFARTYQTETFSDPMLWLYDSEGNLIAANDDWHGLQSHLEIVVPAGLYRLRTGVCCGDPDAWRQGVEYDLGTSAMPINTTTTTESTPTTVEELITTSPTVPLESTTTTETSTTTTESVTAITEPLEASTTTVRSDPTTTTVSEAESPKDQNTTNFIETLPSNESINSQVAVESSTTVLPTTTSTTLAITTTRTSTETTVPLPALRPTATTTTQESAPQTLLSTTTMQESEPLSSITVQKTVPIAEIISTNLSEVTEAEAIGLVQSIDVELLTDTQKELLAEKLSEAPTKVKEAFEEKVNVYGGGFDNYVPAGSTVPVSTRRVIVAVSGVLFAMPTAAASSSASGKRK